MVEKNLWRRKTDKELMGQYGEPFMNGYDCYDKCLENGVSFTCGVDEG